MFGEKLVHEFLISYSHTEWYLFFCDSSTAYIIVKLTGLYFSVTALLFHIFTLLVLPSSLISLFYSCCSHGRVFGKTLLQDFISYCHIWKVFSFSQGEIVLWPKPRLAKTNQTKIDFGHLNVYCFFVVRFWNIVSCQSSNFLLIMGGFWKYIF